MTHATIRSTIEEYRMIERGDRVLAAVSGGVDSIVLIDALAALAPELGFALHVAHIDHNLRGKTSRADARFVEQRAAELGLPFVRAALSADALAPHRTLGPEGAAREARRALLLRLADQVGAARIALGHTASDSAETVLHHMTRGTGGTGLRGIPPVSLPFIRPLIRLDRTALLACAAARSLAWREDGSNADLGFTRNRLRHRVLPELERINPRAAEAILRTASLVDDLHRVAEDVVSERWNEIVLEDGATLSRQRLSMEPPALQRLLLREGIARARGDLTGIERVHVEAIRELIASGRAHGELSLPDLHIQLEQDRIAFALEKPVHTTPWVLPAPVGTTEIPQVGLALSLERMDRSDRDVATQDPWTEIADEAQVAFPLEVRSRREGDRFAPLGLGRETKLKDFLIREKVPYSERDRVALLCDQERVLWVIGVRLSHDVRVVDDTKHLLVMHAEALS